MIVAMGNDTICRNGITALYTTYPDDVLKEYKPTARLLIGENGRLVKEQGKLVERITFLGHSREMFFGGFSSPEEFVNYLVRELDKAKELNPSIINSLKIIDLISCEVGLVDEKGESFAQRVADGLYAKGYQIQINSFSNLTIPSSKIAVSIPENSPFSLIDTNSKARHSSLVDIRTYFDHTPACQFKAKALQHVESKEETKAPASVNTSFIRFCADIESEITKEIAKRSSIHSRFATDSSTTAMKNIRHFQTAFQKIKTDFQSQTDIRLGLNAIKECINLFKSDPLTFVYHAEFFTEIDKRIVGVERLLGSAGSRNKK